MSLISWLVVLSTEMRNIYTNSVRSKTDGTKDNTSIVRVHVEKTKSAHYNLRLSFYLISKLVKRLLW